MERFTVGARIGGGGPGLDKATKTAVASAASAEPSVVETDASRTREMVTAALLAAMLAASAWISIPVGTAVPVTLQVFIVLLAGLLLTVRGAVSAVGVYLLLGAAGLPVFAGGLGGWGVLAGPTGGYLWGFLAAAMIVAWLRIRFKGLVGRAIGEAVALATGVIVIYALGWVQLVAVTAMEPWSAFTIGVLPFIPLDAFKVVAVIGVAGALRRAGVVG